MMARIKNKIITAITAIGLSAAVILVGPFQSSAAAASYNTESSVKNALYAMAYYSCISTYGSVYLQNTAVGNALDSVLASASTLKVYIGTWLGDSNGMITCSDAIKKTHLPGNITASMVTGIYNGVYDYGGGDEKKIQCNYGIVNSEATATFSGIFHWPQGYYRDFNGNLVDKTGHAPVTIVYNDDGPIRLEGGTSDLNTTHTLESMKGWSIDWSTDSAICRNLVQYTEVYEYPAQNAYGEPITAYTEILSTTDGTPFHEWGIHVDDSYGAWLHNNSDKYSHTRLDSGGGSTQLTLASNAVENFKTNISNIYLDGATDATSFFNAHPDAKYIMYGRHLFNGDGGFSGGCGGVTVSRDDPGFSTLNRAYWDTSLEYIASFNAYAGGTSSKSGFLTKFGGNGLETPGVRKSVTFPGAPSDNDCKKIAQDHFSGIEPTSSTAKTTVYGYMNPTAIAELPPENDPDPGPGGGEGSDETTGETPWCYQEAKTLGWILCPVLKAVGGAVQGAYDFLENHFLEVESDGVAASRGSWNTIRGWANVIFAIVFVVVLLSQITGIGISNYGIKKLLPRLIMVVILTNLSFLICQLAVDVSNIVGSGIKELLEGIEVTSRSGVDPGGVISGIFASLVSGAAITGIAIAAGSTWEFWLPALLLALIGVLISAFFALVVLGVRQSLVIIMIVLAPAAIICYALPNTKSLFDKWFKLFQSLLLVYPIAGALMGMGKFGQKLLMAEPTPGFVVTVVAMLLPVVPFFMIPGLVRNSLNGLGQLGNKIAGFGQRMSGGIQRGIRNSDGYREMQRSFSKVADNRRINRLAGRENLSAGQQRRLGRYTARRAENERIDAKREAQAQRARTGGLQGILDAERSGEEKRAMEGQVMDRLAAYESDAGFNMTDLSGGVNPNTGNYEMGAVEAEYNRALDRLDENPEDTNALIDMRAIQRYLATQGDAGQELINRTFTRRIGANATSNGRAWNDPNLGATGLSLASQYIAGDGAFMKSIKESDRGLFSMVNDFNSQQYNRFDRQTTTAEAYYGSRGAGAYSSQTLAGANDGALDRLAEGVQNGTITGDELSRLMTTAEGTIANGEKLNLKGNTRARIQRILNNGYAAGARSFDRHNLAATAGSSAMLGAGAASLNAMATTIRNANGGAAFNPADYGTFNAAQRAEYDSIQATAENARLALHDPNARFNNDQVAALQSIISAARDHGVLQMSATTPGGSGTFANVDPAYISTRDGGSSTPARVIESMTQNYAAGQGITHASSSTSTPVHIDATDFSGASASSIATEHRELIQAYASAPSQAVRDEVQVKLSAVQNVMAQSAAGQEAMYQNFSSLSGTGGTGMVDALKFAGQQIHSSSNMGTISQQDVGLAGVVDSLRSSGALTAGTSYNVRAAQGLSADALAAQSAESVNRMATEIWSSSTPIASADATSLARTVGSVFRTHGASLDAARQADFSTIAARCLANQTSGVDKTAALAFARTGHEASDGVVSFIHDAAGNTANHDQLIRIGQNVRAAFDAKGNTEEAKANLRSILKALGEAGLRDPSNNRSFDPDAPQIVT